MRHALRVLAAAVAVLGVADGVLLVVASFRAVAWWGDILLVLALLGLALGAVFTGLYLTAIRSLKYSPELVDVWRRGRWEEQPCWIHPDSWVCRILRVWGLCIGRHVWLRYGPPASVMPMRKGRPVTQRWQAGHEIGGHFVQWALEPDVWLAVRFGAQALVIRHKAKRPLERFAYAVQHAVATGTAEHVQFPGNWFARMFPDNYGDPDDPSTERRSVGARHVVADVQHGIRRRIAA